MGILDFLTSDRFGNALMATGEGLSAIDSGRPANMAPYVERGGQIARQRRMSGLAEKITDGGILGQILQRQGYKPEAVGILSEALKAHPEGVLPHVLGLAFPKGVKDPYSRYKIAGGRVVDLAGPDGPRVAIGAPDSPADPMKTIRNVPGVGMVDFADPKNPRVVVAAEKNGSDPLAKAKALAAAEGHKPGTPEFNAAVLRHGGKSGISVGTDENGNLRVDIGGGAKLGKAATNTLEKDVAAGDELIARMDDIAKRVGWDEKTGRMSDDARGLFTYPERAKAGAANLADKIGIDGVVPEEWGEITKRRQEMITSVEGLFNEYRKEITGAAAAVAELDRLKATYINKDMGPKEFEAAFGQIRKMAIKVRGIKVALLKNGIDPDTPTGRKMLDEAYKTATRMENDGAAKRPLSDLSDDELRRLYGGGN